MHTASSNVIFLTRAVAGVTSRQVEMAIQLMAKDLKVLPMFRGESDEAFPLETLMPTSRFIFTELNHLKEIAPRTRAALPCNAASAA